MTRVLVASSSRADITALAGVVWACNARPGLEVEVLLTGRHVLAADDFSAAERQLPDDCVVYKAGEDLGGAGPLAASEAMGEIAKGVGHVFAKTKPDLLLVLGDRLDMIPVVLASLPFNLPVAHVHGGELTYGAVDDRVRHAVTKLSHLHFTANAEAAARICRMGEEPWRVQVVGAPAIDALKAVPEMSRAEFGRAVGLPEHGPFILATVHPETNSVDPLAPLEAVLGAVQDVGCPVLFSAANADMGGTEINERIAAVAENTQRVYFRDTLGQHLFANAMRHASLMLGNSSSGIVEAGAFGLAVLDVGERQAGRLRGSNVLNVPSDAEAVSSGIDAQLGKRFDIEAASPYGDGCAAQRIAQYLEELPTPSRLRDKVHFDGDASFTAPWTEYVTGLSVSRSKTPELSNSLTTKSMIVESLQRLDVKKGSVVCVHSALSRLGFVVGGSCAVIEALIEAVGERGTVVMPSFSGHLSDPAGWRFPPVPEDWVTEIRKEMPGYEADRSQTRRMGAVAEHFRRWPGVQRSPHPQSSFSAIGPEAKYLVARHSLDFRFGADSPLARLEEKNATIVLLSAPRNTASIFYRTQEDSGAIERVKKCYPVREDSNTVWVESDDIVYENNFFFDAIEYLLHLGVARRLEFHEQEWIAFEAAPALSEIRIWRREKGI